MVNIRAALLLSTFFLPYTLLPRFSLCMRSQPSNLQHAPVITAMLSTVPLNASRRRVFGSVFSPASLEARPPLAYSFEHDQTALASFQSTTSFATEKADSQSQPFVTTQDTLSDRETWDEAWSAATGFLAVPNLGFAPIYDARGTDGSEMLKKWNRLTPPSKETADALSYLAAAAQQTIIPQAGTGSRDLFSWYGDEIRRHFLTNLRAGLYEVCYSAGTVV